MNSPLVSVIIVTLDNEVWLGRCLENLFKQKYKPVEIFVVDNSSKNNKEIFKKKFSFIKYITSGKNIGYGRAANLALKIAKGKYVLIYNDDALCTPDFISLLVKRMEKDEKIGAAQGTMLHEDNRSIVESVGSYLTPTGILIKESEFKYDKKNLHEKKVFNANLPLIRKDVLDGIGFFDDDYFLYFEEADLCWRIWLSGRDIIYFPPAITYHARSVTARRLNPRIVVESTFKNRLNSLLKNLEIKSLIKIIPLHLLICLGGICAYLLKGKIYSASAILKAIIWNLIHLQATMRKRKKIQNKRKISDKELFRTIIQPMKISYFWNMSKGYLRQW